jgi:hypothetical protein
VTNLRSSLQFVPVWLTDGPLDGNLTGVNETMLYLGPGETAQETYVFTMPEKPGNTYVFPIVVKTLGSHGGLIFSTPMPGFNFSATNQSQPDGGNQPEPPEKPACPLGLGMLAILVLAFARSQGI